MPTSMRAVEEARYPGSVASQPPGSRFRNDRLLLKSILVFPVETRPHAWESGGVIYLSSPPTPFTRLKCKQHPVKYLDKDVIALAAIPIRLNKIDV